MDNNRVPDVIARMEARERAAAAAAPVLAVERRARRQRVVSLSAWSHKNEGTCETHANAAKTRQGALARLFESGAIDREQLEWAAEISAVAESIERDVSVRTASMEARVDASGRFGVALIEGVRWVRLQMAYTRWRLFLPMPKRLVLDMIVGDPIGFTVAARRYGVHNRRAKKLLIQAIDRWPDCVEWACNQVDRDDIAALCEQLR